MTEPTPTAEPATEPSAATEPAAVDAPVEVDESGPELPELPVSPVTEQHPALDGTPEGAAAEVAQRGAEPAPAGVFARTFTVSGVSIPDDHPMHAANMAEVERDAVRRGLRPTGPVALAGATVHDVPLNPAGTRRSMTTELRYEVPVRPASVGGGG